MSIFSFIFRTFRKIKRMIICWIQQIISMLKFNGNCVSIGHNLKFNGIPEIDVHRTATFKIGNNCVINSGIVSNPIGRYTPSFFMVRENANLIIGNNVGISSAAIICHKGITIEDNVKIGGGVCLYDTDFHSLNPIDRGIPNMDKMNANSSSILIKENAFIGAHSTILKGITIGENSIVGACSVVTKDIPDNEIWAGNPAQKIKEL